MAQPEWTEADITINGTKLSFAQAITVRVAVTGFMMELKLEGLGDDPTGKEIAEGYMARGKEIMDLISKGESDEKTE